MVLPWKWIVLGANQPCIRNTRFMVNFTAPTMRWQQPKKEAVNTLIMRLTESAYSNEFLSVRKSTSQLLPVVCIEHNELLRILPYILPRPLRSGEGTEADLISLPGETWSFWFMFNYPSLFNFRHGPRKTLKSWHRGQLRRLMQR